MNLTEEKINGSLLLAPVEFWQMSESALSEIAQGCGPGSGWKEKIVPNTIYFLKIIAACKIHDFMYHFGETKEDKLNADVTFLRNLLRIIRQQTSFWPLKWLRRKRAYKYYEAVVDLGNKAFWKNKIKQ